MQTHEFWFIVAIFCLASFACIGQPSPGWMAQYHVDILESMKIDYLKPDGFQEVPGNECFKSIPKLELIITCAGNQLRSRDGEFIAFIPVVRLYTKEDSIFFQKVDPNGAFKGVDRVHESNIRGDILFSLGEDAAQDWKKYVHYYSSETARNKFNADTAVSLSIKLERDDYFQGRYSHLDALYLQKKGRGYINFYCFYTDKAKRNLSTYWEAIERTFRYR